VNPLYFNYIEQDSGFGFMQSKTILLQQAAEKYLERVVARPSTGSGRG
jgi:hypothetical protein